ncbi:MAG TPA: cupredoxin domain-containing protein [Ferrovibrio sp.]|uniref:cupredoxin domain-containing protein n=1 Tax=Ferrovibrio sp. TaxID=1917215 RepID=UPI002ED2FA8B
MSIRVIRAGTLAGAAGLLAAFAAGNLFAVASSPAEPVIRITARRFEYIPPSITLKKGQPVTLELTAEDTTHGFKVSELGIRADAIPGKVTVLHVTPDKAGKFYFACDVFCGAEHDYMSGEIAVTE